MTTVAFRFPFLAADRRAGDFMRLSKIFPLGKGYVAGCGIYDQIVEIANWMNNGAKEEERPSLPEGAESTVLVIDEHGVCFWLTTPYLRPIKVDEPFIAVGSGGQYAMGAMARGASAEEAVRVACEYDPNTGFGVDCVRVGPKPKRARKKA